MLALSPTTVVAAAAVIQAGAAAVIVVLTKNLADATRDYVAEMQTANKLQEEANRITASGLAVAQGQLMPRLIATPRSRSANADTVTKNVDVANFGGGAAENVVLETDWGRVELNQPLGPGERQRVQLTLPRPDWDQRYPVRAEGDPKIVRFMFKSPDGRSVVQEVSE